MSTYLTKTDPSTESSNAHDEVARVVWLCRNKKAATVELRRRAKEINRARANVEERTENLHMFTKHAKRHVYATAPRALHSPLSLKTLMRQLSPEAKRLLRLKEHSLEEFKQLEHEQRLASGEPALISMVQEKEDWFAAMQKTEEAIQHLHALHMTLPLVVETAQAPLDPKLAAFEKQYMDWDLEKQKKSYVGH